MPDRPSHRDNENLSGDCGAEGWGDLQRETGIQRATHLFDETAPRRQRRALRFDMIIKFPIGCFVAFDVFLNEEVVALG